MMLLRMGTETMGLGRGRDLFSFLGTIFDLDGGPIRQVRTTHDDVAECSFAQGAGIFGFTPLRT